MDYARSVIVEVGQDEAIEMTRAALAEQGFGWRPSPRRPPVGLDAALAALAGGSQ